MSAPNERSLTDAFGFGTRGINQPLHGVCDRGVALSRGVLVGQRGRSRWAIDRGTPAVISTAAFARPVVEPSPAQRRERLEAERQALLAQIPREPGAEVVENARPGGGPGRVAGDRSWRGGATPLKIQSARHLAAMSAESPTFGTRHAAKRTARQLARLEPEASARFEALAAPLRDRLRAKHEDLTDPQRELLVEREARTSWLNQHPEVQHGLTGIERELAPFDRGAELTTSAERERELDYVAEVELPPLPGF